MISASEARANVQNYKDFLYAETKKIVTEILDDMDMCIQFHSENGLEEVTFHPYTTSHFPSQEEMEIAERIFSATFINFGYTIIKNSFADNILIITW